MPKIKKIISKKKENRNNLDECYKCFEIYNDISLEELEKISFEIGKLGCTSFFLSKEEIEELLKDKEGNIDDIN